MTEDVRKSVVGESFYVPVRSIWVGPVSGGRGIRVDGREYGLVDCDPYFRFSCVDGSSC